MQSNKLIFAVFIFAILVKALLSFKSKTLTLEGMDCQISTDICRTEDLSVRRTSDGVTIYGILGVGPEFGNKYLLTGVVYKKQGNTYKKTLYVYGPSPLCHFILTDKFYMDELKALGIIPKNTCPLPEGDYNFTGIKLDPDKLASTLNGYYKINVNLKSKTDEIICDCDLRLSVL